MAGSRLSPEWNLANYRFSLGTTNTGGARFSYRPALAYKGSAVSMVRHHIFNKFHAPTPSSLKYINFFKSRGINVDDFCVDIPVTFHREWIHKAGRNWTTTWKRWIDDNPVATTLEVYQQGGRMMNEAGINHLPIIPYQ
jgi:hypothetical protein